LFLARRNDYTIFGMKLGKTIYIRSLLFFTNIEVNEGKYMKKIRTKKFVGVFLAFLILMTVGTTVSSAGPLKDLREIKNKIIEIKEASAELQEMLDEFGFVIPKLTKEQKEEIRAAIIDILEEDYGFVIPELTKEQKQEIQETIKELIAQGATPEEIKEAVISLLEGYGAAIPELTEEQKEEIKERIKSLLEDNYGFILPELTEEQKDEIKNKKSEIKNLQMELKQLIEESSPFIRWLIKKIFSKKFGKPKF